MSHATAIASGESRSTSQTPDSSPSITPIFDGAPLKYLGMSLVVLTLTAGQSGIIGAFSRNGIGTGRSPKLMYRSTACTVVIASFRRMRDAEQVYLLLWRNPWCPTSIHTKNNH